MATIRWVKETYKSSPSDKEEVQLIAYHPECHPAVGDWDQEANNVRLDWPPVFCEACRKLIGRYDSTQLEGEEQ